MTYKLPQPRPPGFSSTGWTKSTRSVQHSISVFEFFKISRHPKDCFSPLYSVFVSPYFSSFYDFYQHPVELEQVTSNELLGFLVDQNIQTVTYKLRQPQPPWFSSTGWTKSTMSVQHSTSVFDFTRTQAPTDFPIVQASLLCHIFQTVNVVVFFFWAAD